MFERERDLKIKTSFNLNLYFLLQENFQACLQVNWMQNSTWQPPVTLRVDLGKPLVAVLDLWYDPRAPPSQENAQVQRKMPVESEC